MEVTSQALTRGWHWGQRHVTQEAARITRSVARSVLASRLLVRWYGHDEALCKEWSLCKRKERWAAEVAPDAVTRTELKWPRQRKPYTHVA